jgi:excisionase family DNA binding protein
VNEEQIAGHGLVAAASTEGRILMGYRQAAKALGISQRTLSNLVKAGGIPVVRIGARVLFRPAALAAWAEAREAAGGIVSGTFDP